jgi:hypothetical protein
VDKFCGRVSVTYLRNSERLLYHPCVRIHLTNFSSYTVLEETVFANQCVFFFVEKIKNHVAYNIYPLAWTFLKAVFGISLPPFPGGHQFISGARSSGLLWFFFLEISHFSWTSSVYAMFSPLFYLEPTWNGYRNEVFLLLFNRFVF